MIDIRNGGIAACDSDQIESARSGLSRFSIWLARSAAAASLCALVSANAYAAGAPVYSLAFSPNGKLLATGRYAAIQLWDFERGEESAVLLPEGGTAGYFWSVAFSPDGTLLASANGKSVRLWDVATGRQLRMIKDGTETQASTLMYSVAFSPDGHTLLTGSGSPILWDVATGTRLNAGESDGDVDNRGYDSGSNRVAFTPNGKTIAVGTQHHGIHVYETATLKVLGRLGGSSKAVVAVAYSPDGKVLATGGEDRLVRLWNLSTGEVSQTFQGFSDMVISVVFSKDGKKLAAADQNEGLIKIWNVADGSVSATIRNEAGVWALAFSPDGRLLVSGGGSNDFGPSINVWTVSTGKLQRKIKDKSQLMIP